MSNRYGSEGPTQKQTWLPHTATATRPKHGRKPPTVLSPLAKLLDTLAQKLSHARNYAAEAFRKSSAHLSHLCRRGRCSMTPDPLAYQNWPQAAVIILGTLTFALFCWLPAPTVEQPAAACERPIFMPTATDAPEYSWTWPLQEQADEEATDEPVRRRHHRRRG